MMQRQKIGIVGFGQFGQFMCGHLEKYFEVIIFKKEEEGIDEVNVLKEKLADLDYLILAVPFSAFEEVCKKYSQIVSENTIIVDVTSVKVRLIKLMKRYFLNNSILGTHPIFGPQSGRNGIEGLPIVLTNVSVEAEKYSGIKKFLSEVFKLNVIEKTAEEHDKEMAYVQGLSHFIGRTLEGLQIENFDSATKGYKSLINLKEIVGQDTWELYKTIQNANPYTDEVREKFLQGLNDLETRLRSER